MDQNEARPTVRIKDLPPEERPRERLLAQGTGALTDAELLAVLVGSGSSATGESALDLARRMLAAYADPGVGEDRAGVLRRLAAADVESLCALPGIGPAKASQIHAGIELGRRIAAHRAQRGAVRRPEEVYRLLVEEMRLLSREEFRTILLNTRHRVLGVRRVSVGSLDETIVEPREVFAPALARRAAAIILVHNHPSGEADPSARDVAVTRRLRKAGELLGVTVVDHIIIGDGCYTSFRENGLVWT